MSSRAALLVLLWSLVVPGRVAAVSVGDVLLLTADSVLVYRAAQARVDRIGSVTAAYDPRAIAWRPHDGSIYVVDAGSWQVGAKLNWDTPPTIREHPSLVRMNPVSGQTTTIAVVGPQVVAGGTPGGTYNLTLSSANDLAVAPTGEVVVSDYDWCINPNTVCDGGAYHVVDAETGAMIGSYFDAGGINLTLDIGANGEWAIGVREGFTNARIPGLPGPFPYGLRTRHEVTVAPDGSVFTFWPAREPWHSQDRGDIPDDFEGIVQLESMIGATQWLFPLDGLADSWLRLDAGAGFVYFLDGPTSLWRLDVASGSATALAELDVPVLDLAVVALPEAGSAGLGVLGLAGIAGLLRLRAGA